MSLLVSTGSDAVSQDGPTRRQTCPPRLRRVTVSSWVPIRVPSSTSSDSAEATMSRPAET